MLKMLATPSFKIFNYKKFQTYGRVERIVRLISPLYLAPSFRNY